MFEWKASQGKGIQYNDPADNPGARAQRGGAVDDEEYEDDVEDDEYSVYSMMRILTVDRIFKWSFEIWNCKHGIPPVKVLVLEAHTLDL